MNALKAYFLATRPKTLAAAIVPVAAACILVQAMTGGFGKALALWTLLSAICIQIATNLFNDVIDMKKNADTKKRQGPKRVTASGMLSSKAVYAGAFVFVLLAILCSLPLMDAAGKYAWVIVAIGAPSLYLSYGYTGGFFPLAYRGMGELFVFIFFGLIAVIGSVFVQVGWPLYHLEIYRPAIPLAMQCGFLSTVIIMINNIRDRKEDEKTNKRTLAVRWGDYPLRRLAMACVVAPYLLIITLSRAMQMELTWAWGPSLLFGAYLMLKIGRTPADKRMNKLIPMASLHYVFFVATFGLVAYLAKS